jgi:hypothetical protein
MIGRIATVFVVAFFALYAAIVVLLPAPALSDNRGDIGGTEAAARLSQQAQSLVTHRPGDLQ